MLPEIYLLQSVDKPTVTDAQLADPRVAGLSIRVSWRKCNPGPNQCEWDFLFDQVARAVRFHKRVMIRFMAGKWAPDWIPVGRVQSSDSPGELSPVVWSEEYLWEWCDFLAFAGEEVLKASGVACVHYSGVSSRSAEFHLDKALGWQLDYSPKKIIEAHRRCLVAFAFAFRHLPVVLNVSNAMTGDDGIPEAVINMGRVILGDRLRLQHNALSAKTKEDWRIHQLVTQSGAPHGFQMLSGSAQDRFGGTFDEALAKADGAQYLEIYRSDLDKLPPYQPPPDDEQE